MAEDPVMRTDLMTAFLDGRSVSRVDIKQITLSPGQAAPRHYHPCPVVGYVAAGTLLFQAEGSEPVTIPQGGAFFEPAGHTILHFDNASSTEPMTFIAFYLRAGEEEIIAYA